MAPTWTESQKRTVARICKMSERTFAIQQLLLRSIGTLLLCAGVPMATLAIAYDGMDTNLTSTGFAALASGLFILRTAKLQGIVRDTGLELT